MKFLVTKELSQNRLLSLMVLFLVGILALFLLSDILLHHYQIGLTPIRAFESILGDKEAFVEPMLFDALLERVHIDIFTSMITLILLIIIYIRLNPNTKNKIIHFTFIAAILTPISLILGYFYGTEFIILWIILFLLWHSSALYFAFIIFWKLLR